MAFLAPAIPFILGASAVVGTGLALYQGRAARKENKARAELERTQSALEAKQSERMSYLRLGAIRAAHGKSGGAYGEGSALDVIADVTAQGELERQQILSGGAVRSDSYERRARNEQTAGYLSAGSELLSGSAATYDAFKRR